VLELVEWVENVENRSREAVGLCAVRIGERTERESEREEETGDSDTRAMAISGKRNDTRERERAWEGRERRAKRRKGRIIEEERR
jgi:hypothetical protein